MADFKITFDSKKLREIKLKFLLLQSPINQETARNLGKDVVDEIRDLTAKGISSVRGGVANNRMPGYKNPERYPGKRKSPRPVNLRLTGEMMRALTYKIAQDIAGYKTTIYYKDDLSDKKESGHREGVNGQPKRPTLPITAKGEDFASRIMRIINNYYRARIREILK